ncbi:hypothetical protein [Polaribacter sp.]|uniref:hypothetical protein n=1 Tax=Polaribacter sp. TaxID=1920175 RepID=UPI0025F11F86|nr:hypothetical protein [Polaribacter sp.]
MKTIKLIVCFCVTIALTSCGDDNENSDLLLTNSNLAGNYTIENLTGEENETATSTSGAIVDLATSTIVGNTFKVELLINANGTYSISGPYVEVKNTTPNGGPNTETTDIPTTDTNGTYQLNGIENTITFTAENGNFLSGTYNVNTLTQNRFIISKNSLEPRGSNTITSKIIIDFLKV